jgi:hypothetical protein
MQLYSQTLTWIIISVCVLRVNTRCPVKNLSPKWLFLLTKLRKALWSRMQLYSHTLTWITISVYVLRISKRCRVKNHLLNG